MNSLSQPLVVCTLGGVSFANYLYSTFATLRDNGGGLHNYTGYTGAMNIALNTSANFSPPFSITLTTVTKYICNADGFLISSSVTPVTVVSAINEGSGVVIRLTW